MNLADYWRMPLDHLGNAFGVAPGDHFLHTTRNALVTAGSFMDSVYLAGGSLTAALCLAAMFGYTRHRDWLEERFPYFFSGLLAGQGRRAEVREVLGGLFAEGISLQLHDASGQPLAIGRIVSIGDSTLTVRLPGMRISREKHLSRTLAVYFRPMQGQGGFRNHFHATLLKLDDMGDQIELATLRLPQFLSFSPRRRYPRLDLPRRELVAGHLWFGKWEDGSNAFQRHSPALDINRADADVMQQARVEDISAGGMRLSLPGNGRGGAFSRGREVCLQLFVAGMGGERSELWLGAIATGVQRSGDGRMLVSFKFAAYGLPGEDGGFGLLNWSNVDASGGLPSIASLVSRRLPERRSESHSGPAITA